jgi:hypothetical protein
MGFGIFKMGLRSEIAASGFKTTPVVFHGVIFYINQKFKDLTMLFSLYPNLVVQSNSVTP